MTYLSSFPCQKGTRKSEPTIFRSRRSIDETIQNLDSVFLKSNISSAFSSINTNTQESLDFGKKSNWQSIYRKELINNFQIRDLYVKFRRKSPWGPFSHCITFHSTDIDHQANKQRDYPKWEIISGLVLQKQAFK